MYGNRVESVCLMMPDVCIFIPNKKKNPHCKPCWDIFYCLGRFCKSAIPGWYQYLYGLNMTFDIPMEKHRKLI